MKFRIPENIIEREAYTRRIEPFMRKQIIKVLTGQRRVGKSYLLYQIMKRILDEDDKANIIYINFEDIGFSFIKSVSDLAMYIKTRSLSEVMNYIFIDEIQEIPEFEKAVRSLLTDDKNDIYITGSNARLFSGELSTLLGGRTIEIRVSSLAYTEFLKFHKLKDCGESLDLYLQYGGLPYLVNLKLDFDIVFEYLKNIYNTIIYRDVVSRYKIRNTYFLEQLIKFLAGNTGSLVSSKSISDFLKSQKILIPHNQVQLYAGYLCDAFLIKKVSRYDIQGKRFFETGDKYYFEDLGIRNTITGFKPDDKAKIIENVVYNELIFRGFEVSTGWKKNYEIDFVATKYNEKTYIQVALILDSEVTVKREFGNLLEIDDNYPKMVVTTDRKYRNTIEGVEHVNFRDFLVGNST